MTDKHDDATAELLIREVDEELRQEQFGKLWKRHGIWAIGGVVVLIAGVAGWQGWSSWQTRQRNADSAAFTQAIENLDGGKRDQALAALDRLAAGKDGYALLARLKQGDLKVQSGDMAGAIAVYDAIAAGGAPEVYRNLALLKSAYLKVDTADPASLDKAVAPLAAEVSPWRHSAREIQALAALRNNDNARAVELLRKIVDDLEAPQALRARATELLAAQEPKAKG